MATSEHSRRAWYSWGNSHLEIKSKKYWADENLESFNLFEIIDIIYQDYLCHHCFNKWYFLSVMGVFKICTIFLLWWVHSKFVFANFKTALWSNIDLLCLGDQRRNKLLGFSTLWVRPSSTAEWETGSKQQLESDRNVYSHPPSLTYFWKGS